MKCSNRSSSNCHRTSDRWSLVERTGPQAKQSGQRTRDAKQPHVGTTARRILRKATRTGRHPPSSRNNGMSSHRYALLIPLALVLFSCTCPLLPTEPQAPSESPAVPSGATASEEAGLRRRAVRSFPEPPCETPAPLTRCDCVGAGATIALTPVGGSSERLASEVAARNGIAEYSAAWPGLYAYVSSDTLNRLRCDPAVSFIRLHSYPDPSGSAYCHC